MNTTRIGKIARLPHSLRQQLNQRLADGEMAATLLQWLNELDPVKVMLAEHFNGVPISEQNLSEWRQGGYQDWLRNQEVRAEARAFLDEAEELEDEIGHTPVTDRISDRLALSLLRLLREAEAEAETGPQRRKAILEIVREFQLLRRGDHQMKRVRLDEERWDIEEEQREAEHEAAEKAEMEAMQHKARITKIQTGLYADQLRDEYENGIKSGTLAPERETKIRELFETQSEWLKKIGVQGLSPYPNGIPTRQAPDHNGHEEPPKTGASRRASKNRAGSRFRPVSELARHSVTS